MLQNPVHVVIHLALNKQYHYFSFLDFFSNYYDLFLENFIIFTQIIAIPSYIEDRTSNYDNKGDE